MIPDWDTNHLFLSDRLLERQPALFVRLCSALKDVPIDIIRGTADIWCRDFMPVQLDEDTFCKFVYAPDYLCGYEHTITPLEKCRLHFMKKYRQERIVLDGGNVVASRKKVILTDKISNENLDIAEPHLLQRLEEVFQAKCIVIPWDKEDEVGHSDGVVRFVAEDSVLMNDYSSIAPGYGEEVQKVLKSEELRVETLPLFEEETERRRSDDLPSAVGLYLNYLRVGNIVVMPGFGRPEDQVALEKMQRVLPDAAVSQVPCRSLAEAGGVLNCISWTIRI